MSNTGRRLSDARGLAKYLGCSLSEAWRKNANADETGFPKPFYVSASSPRWDLNEIDQWLETTRARPAEKRESRRQAKLAMAG